MLTILCLDERYTFRWSCVTPQNILYLSCVTPHIHIISERDINVKCVCCICRGYIPHIHPLFDYKLESECIYDVNLHPNWCSLSSGNDVVLKCIQRYLRHHPVSVTTAMYNFTTLGTHTRRTFVRDKCAMRLVLFVFWVLRAEKPDRDTQILDLI